MSLRFGRSALCTLALLVLPAAARADGPVVNLDSGDTAWMLLSTALVFLMTPGLAFFTAAWCAARTSSACSCNRLSPPVWCPSSGSSPATRLPSGQITAASSATSPGLD